MKLRRISTGSKVIQADRGCSQIKAGAISKSETRPAHERLQH